MPQPTIPILIGPTAGGKSALAVALAHTLHSPARGPRRARCAILAADAFQVYKRMDIGTAKPTAAEREGIPHELIDLVEPSGRFTAADWLSACEACITRCEHEGLQPIIVGGTHLYVKLLLDGLFEGPGADEAIRAELRALAPETLRAELVRVDPEIARRLHPNDQRRTIRAIEVFRLTGKPMSAMQGQWDKAQSETGGAGAEPEHSRFVLVGLEWPTQLINRRINARVASMMERGLLEETRALLGSGELGPQTREALGYKQLLGFLAGHHSLDAAFERIKIETRRFAKNQRTWLQRLKTTPRSLWLTLPEPTSVMEQPAADIPIVEPPIDVWTRRILEHLDANARPAPMSP